MSEEELPIKFESVLAEILYLNSLGKGIYHEVVFHDGNKWCSYFGSDTFKCGEKVIRWKYVKEVFE